MDIDAVLRYISQQSTHSATGSKLVMAETYEVLWSGTKDTEFQKSQQRPAPSIEEHKGNRPVFPAGFGHTKEDQGVIDLRTRWQKEKQKT